MRYGQDKYRFTICTNGVDYIPVMLVKPITISGDREDKLWDYRRKSSEWKIVRHENPDVYDDLKIATESPSTQTIKISVKIELWDDWRTLTSVEYEGYISLSTVKINTDNGTIQFTPEEDDAYAWWDEHKTDKHDIVNEVSAGNTITYDSTTIKKEYWIFSLSPIIGWEALIEETHNISEWQSDNQYYNSNPDYLNYGIDQWVRHGMAWFYEQGVDPIYSTAFYYCKQNHFSASDTEPGVGVNWMTPWAGPYRIVMHIVSQESDLPFTYDIPPEYTTPRGNDLFLSGWPNPVPSPEDTGEERNHPSNVYYIAIPDVITVTDVVLSSQGNMRLFDAMNHMLSGSGLTFRSEFFSSKTNPVTLEDNLIANLFLSHKQYIKNTQNEETKGEISLEDLINDLCELFNCMWYVDANNANLVIEHVKYFEKGKQYTGVQEIYADLTNKSLYPLKYQTLEDINANETDGQFSFGNESPQKEIFKITDTYDNENELLYTSSWVKKGNSVKHSVDMVSTDFKYVMDNHDKSAEDGYCLIACDVNGKLYRRSMTRGMSAITANDYPNGDLMFDNLIREYWMFSRKFMVGKINLDEDETTFETQQKTKIQRDIIMPRLSGAFNPSKLLITNTGHGEVKSFEIRTDTDFIKLSLIYAAG